MVSYRTPYMMLITESLPGSASGGVFWICEQAARTCSAVATEVLGLKLTTIHCWSSALSIFAQPVMPSSATATAAASPRPPRAAAAQAALHPDAPAVLSPTR